MAKTTKKKVNKQSEAYLIKRREQKRESMKKARLKIKQNPILLEESKAKERERYHKRKAKGEIKSVLEMTSREQRNARKMWKKKKSKYRKEIRDKKELEQRLEDLSPPSTPRPLNDDVEIQEQISGGSLRGKKMVRRNRYKLKKKIKELEDKNKKLCTKLEKYKKRVSRLKKADESKKETPRKTVRRELRMDEKSKTFKKLLFTEALCRQIKENFKNKRSPKEKRALVKLLSGKIVKKYRLSNEIKKLTSKKIMDKYNKKTMDIIAKKDLVSVQVKDSVIRFLESDKASRLCSGKKETITRKKEKKQKRYLNDSMYALHQTFKKEYPEYKLSYQTFCRLRPYWILFPKASDRETCLCKTHENMSLLVRKLNSLDIIVEKTTTDILKTMCCDSKNELCLDRKCDECKPKLIKIHEFQDEPINYQKWIRKKEPVLVKGAIKLCPKTVKAELTSTKKQLVEEFLNDIPQFCTHVCNIVHQYEETTKIKTNLSEDEVFLHIDFSENYTCKYNREIQSAHFGGSKPQVTIHTCVMYCNKAAPISFGTISDCNRHDAPAVIAHLLALKEDIKLYVPELRKIHILSDGPSTQYKNKTMFQLIGCCLAHQLNVNQVNWHYCESSHGKGAPDGIGAVLKRTADNLVAHMMDIPDCGRLVTQLQEHCRGVKVLKVEEISIKEIDKLYVPKDIEAFKGTMKIHEVVFKRNGTSLEVRSRTCSTCRDLKCKHFSLGSIQLINTSHTEKLRYQDVYSSSDDEQDKGDNVPENQQTSNLLNKYIVVEFTTKKTFKHFIGIVTNEEPETCIVKFLKKKSDFSFVYPEKEDVSIVEKCCVKKVLSPPNLNRRQNYEFNMKQLTKFLSTMS